MASKPDPQNDLLNAFMFRGLKFPRKAVPSYEQVRKGCITGGTRLDLWQHWDHKLPNNPFVRRQLEARIP